MSEKKQEQEKEVKDFMHSLVESVADEMHFYIYETMGSEYNPEIRKNQEKIKELEKRINNMNSVMENIEHDDNFTEFLNYHKNYFMAALMFAYSTGLPLDYNVYLFDADGALVLEDSDDDVY